MIYFIYIEPFIEAILLFINTPLNRQLSHTAHYAAADFRFRHAAAITTPLPTATRRQPRRHFSESRRHFTALQPPFRQRRSCRVSQAISLPTD